MLIPLVSPVPGWFKAWFDFHSAFWGQQIYANPRCVLSPSASLQKYKADQVKFGKMLPLAVSSHLGETHQPNVVMILTISASSN
jgi:hypothetical protein